MNVDKITAAAARIADELARLATVLDENTYRLDSAADRGIVSRLVQVCRDTSNGLRRPC